MATKPAQTDAAAEAGSAAGAQPSTPAPTPPTVPGRKPGGVFEYVDGTPSTTLFDGFPPQSAEYGDVCDLPYDPEAPCWQPSKKAVNRLPDTHPNEVEKTSVVQAALRAEVHAGAAQALSEQAATAAGRA